MFLNLTRTSTTHRRRRQRRTAHSGAAARDGGNILKKSWEITNHAILSGKMFCSSLLASAFFPSVPPPRSSDGEQTVGGKRVEQFFSYPPTLPLIFLLPPPFTCIGKGGLQVAHARRNPPFFQSPPVGEEEGQGREARDRYCRMAGTAPCSYVVRKKKRVGPYCIISEKQFNCSPLQTIPFTAHCGCVKLFLDFFAIGFLQFYLFFSCRAVMGFSDVPARLPGGGERVVGQREERERSGTNSRTLE